MIRAKGDGARAPWRTPRLRPRRGRDPWAGQSFTLQVGRRRLPRAAGLCVEVCRAHGPITRLQASHGRAALREQAASTGLLLPAEPERGALNLATVNQSNCRSAVRILRRCRGCGEP